MLLMDLPTELLEDIAQYLVEVDYQYGLDEC